MNMYDLDLQEKRGVGGAELRTPFVTITKQPLCGRSVFIDMLYAVLFSLYVSSRSRTRDKRSVSVVT
jgi:hypothetical protein